MNQPGMPPAFPERPPKTKFKPDEDEVLAYLKENRNLTWKQILWWYPGRTSGTLQVRYCTKLKAKDVVWSDEMVCSAPLPSSNSFFIHTHTYVYDIDHKKVQRLRRAIQDYENDRWRIIAGKVGHGFTPTACEQKAAYL